MEAIGGLLTGFGVIVSLDNLFLCFLGSLIGTLVGVLPGVGPLAVLALLLPITFTMTPPQSGHRERASKCPLRAKSGHNAVQRRPGPTRSFDLINNGHDLPPFMSPVINRW
jgi:hypothetical protein